jgi:hypothetical protein
MDPPWLMISVVGEPRDALGALGNDEIESSVLVEISESCVLADSDLVLEVLVEFWLPKDPVVGLPVDAHHARSENNNVVPTVDIHVADQDGGRSKWRRKVKRLSNSPFARAWWACIDNPCPASAVVGRRG